MCVTSLRMCTLHRPLSPLLLQGRQSLRIQRYAIYPPNYKSLSQVFWDGVQVSRFRPGMCVRPAKSGLLGVYGYGVMAKHVLTCKKFCKLCTLNVNNSQYVVDILLNDTYSHHTLSKYQPNHLHVLRVCKEQKRPKLI